MDSLKKYNFNDQSHTVAEYIWLDGYQELRSKIKILPLGNYSIENIPVWNFDGSSTRQSTVEHSEVILRPVRLYNNPFHNNGFIVLCETYTQNDDGTLHPHQSNIRYLAQQHFQYTEYYQPWYGIEQEYYILDSKGNPYNNKDPKTNGRYYCGTNSAHVKGREFADAHMRACLHAGLKVSGINAEVGPSQWEYQIGPVEGIEAPDQLWVSRYILHRLAEECNVHISLHPKPLGSDWPGSGCHVNFSTIQMRLPGGYDEIIRAIENLKQTHDDYISVCGEDSHQRLTGDHETPMLNNFSWANGSRNVSIRIPSETVIKKCGYFEDRRPSSNVEPYTVCGLLLASVIH